MRHLQLRTPKIMPLIPLLALLILAVACGASATPVSVPPTAAPAPVAAPTATAIPALPTGVRPTNTPVPTPTSVATPVPAQQAKAGGTLNMGAFADMDTWDPLGSGFLTGPIHLPGCQSATSATLRTVSSRYIWAPERWCAGSSTAAPSVK